MKDPTDKLNDLAKLLREGLITREEFDTQKASLLTGGHLPSSARPERIGSYQITGDIGQGGMGRVYRGRHRTPQFAERQGGDVAIKVLHPQYSERDDIMERFEREASLGIQLDHPGIVKVLELVVDSGRVALVMELVSGRPLSEMIGAETGPLTWDQARPLFFQLLDAVGYAHKSGVVHRDLKPDNVMVSDDGSLKILDFGIAKDNSTGRTQTGTGMGTVDYMAPEQYLDAKSVDARADIYALGMTLYEMLAGRLPWERSTTEFEILKRKESGDITPPTEFCPTIPPKPLEVLTRMLAHQANDRYPSVQVIRRALGGTEDSSGADPVQRSATLIQPPPAAEGASPPARGKTQVESPSPPHSGGSRPKTQVVAPSTSTAGPSGPSKTLVESPAETAASQPRSATQVEATSPPAAHPLDRPIPPAPQSPPPRKSSGAAGIVVAVLGVLFLFVVGGAGAAYYFFSEVSSSVKKSSRSHKDDDDRKSAREKHDVASVASATRAPSEEMATSRSTSGASRASAGAPGPMAADAAADWEASPASSAPIEAHFDTPEASSVYSIPSSAFRASGSGGTLIVGTGRKAEPMFDTTGSSPRGFDIDLGYELARRLGKSGARFVPSSSSRGDAAKGRVDLALQAISIKPERMDENLFSEPYLNNEFVVVANTRYRGSIHRSNLGRYRCAVGPNSAYKRELTRTGCAVITKSSTDSAMSAVSSGLADFTVIDSTFSGDRSNSSLYRPGITLSTDPYGVAMQLGNYTLKSAVDQALYDMMADGTMHRLRLRYGFD